MANDRYRYDRDIYRDRSSNERAEDGHIARRGFGNERSGYARGRDHDEGYGRGRERDFGDSAGYGTGGSARDWRDVMGEDRDWGYPRSGSERDRYESSSFGRGSRDYNEDRGFFDRAGDEIRSWFGDPEAERRREMDMQTGAFHHRGRGPKGYQRSDARILEDVNDRLTEDPHIDASEIEVSVSNREVTLTGTVNSRFEKRHAEDLAESVSGVTHVQNNLRIQQHADAGMGGSMLSGTGTSSASPATSASDDPTSQRRTRSSSDT